VRVGYWNADAGHRSAWRPVCFNPYSLVPRPSK